MLGNDDPKASVVGEIVPGKEFYDYEAKYLSEGSVPVIPAKLSRAESKKIREMAVAAFRACDLAGLARVDFLMEPEGKQPHLCERSKHHARLHANQHVPQAVGGLGPQLHRSDYAVDRTSAGAASGKEQDDIQQGLRMQRLRGQGLRK